MSHQEDREQLLQQEQVEVRAILSQARLANERPNFRRNYWSGFYMADFDTNYSEAIFDGATLEQTDFSDTDLSSATFKGAIASHLFAADVIAISTEFTDANLTGATFVDSILVGADFTGANLTGATFKDTNLTDAKFLSANLKDAVFTRVTIHGEMYTGSYLSIPLKGVQPQ
jgi:uncharacterized protein YjbI with pentapeptide repeats